MKSLMTAAALGALLVVPALAQDVKLGAGVSIKAATPIASVLAKPEEFVGKTIRVDGIATSVCEAMGCWMAIAAEANSDKTVRIKVEDGVIVFPMSAKGKQVSAEGVWEVVGGDSAHGAHAAAAPHAQHDTTPKKYQLKGTGAIIR